MNKAIALPIVSLLAAYGAAAPKTFQIVGDRLSYRNVATVESESDFETFTGRTNAVSGTISFDPQAKTGSGSLAIDVPSIDTGIPLRNDHMKGEGWLNAEKHPKITFVTTKVERLTGDDYRVTGNFTMKGITKKIVTKAKVRYRANGPETKAAGFEGDVVQLSTRFGIKLSDYGVTIPAGAKGKVSNNVTISLSAYAIAR